MPVKSVHHLDQVATFEAPLHVRRGGNVHLCILQTRRTCIETIREDRSRPETVAALRDLIMGSESAEPRLDSMLPGQPPTVVLAPEHALGSQDWIVVDGIVRKSLRRLVVISGFGNTTGAWLKDWTSGGPLEESPTRLIPGWDDSDRPIARDRPLNGAWCWIHDPVKGTACIGFVKNFLEQKHEVVLFPTLQEGSSIIRIKFADLEIFPTICADLVRPQEAGTDTAQVRIARMLAEAPHDPRPVLVTGSLLQMESNWNWAAAVNDVVSHASVHRDVVLALANQAGSKPTEDENVDRWRNLSGVYVRKGKLTKPQSPLPAGRPLLDDTVAGVLVRTNEPCVVAGTVGWPPYNPVTGNYLWRAVSCVPSGPHGLQPSSDRQEIVEAEELYRYTQRRPAKVFSTWDARVKIGLARLGEHINSAHPPRAAHLLPSLLRGVCKTPEIDPDALHKLASALFEALDGLAALLGGDRVDWQRSRQEDGQLFWREPEINVLVWRDPDRGGGTIARDLQAWTRRPGPHPLLLVLAKGERTPLPAGKVSGDRRTSIDEPPPPIGSCQRSASSDITAPSGERTAALASLEQVAQFYMEQANSADAYDALFKRFEEYFS